MLLIAIATAVRARAGRLALDDLPAAPAGATYGPPWEAAAKAALPSTVGLGVLGGAALAFRPSLAGFCAGLLVGIALLGLAAAVLLAVEERRDGRRLYVDRGILEPRRYVGPS